MRLARTFAATFAGSPGEELVPLDARLAAIVDAARRAWPTVDVPDEEYIRYLAERLPADRVAEDVERLHTADLYLACACGRGDAAGRAAFEQVLADVRTVVTKVAGNAADDVTQMVRERLLFGEPAKIADYAGTGELLSWVRVVAVRTALGLRRGQAREVAVGDAVLDALRMPLVTTDPQVEHLKTTYHAEFRVALRDSLQVLDDRERALLRYRYLYGASIDEIARIYEINRATAARWAAKAEEHLRDATHAVLMQRLGIERAELESVMRLLQSHLDASLHDLLSQSA